MFRFAILEGNSPFSVSKGVECICSNDQRQLYREHSDFYFMWLTFETTVYACVRCGSLTTLIDYVPLHNLSLEEKSIMTSLLQWESDCVRPFVLRHVRRQFEMWLNDFLIVDLVDLVTSYLYIEQSVEDSNPIVVDQLKTKRRKIM